MCIFANRLEVFGKIYICKCLHSTESPIFGLAEWWVVESAVTDFIENLEFWVHENGFG